MALISVLCVLLMLIKRKTANVHFDEEGQTNARVS